MSQEYIVFILTITYVLSSWVGAVLFTATWRVTRKDRRELKRVPKEDSRIARLRNSAAWRNEYIGGIMALAFWMYAVAGALGLMWLMGFELPWERGLVTTFLLVAGNVLEMTVAIALVYARMQMNRDGEQE